MDTIPSKQLHQRAATKEALLAKLSDREIGYCDADGALYIKVGNTLVGEGNLMVVHIGSIPGVGPCADKSYSEMLAALDAGKSIIAVDPNRWEFVVYKVDTSSGYIDFIRPGVSEIDGTGVGSLPDAMTTGVRIHSNGTVEGTKKYTVGKRYWSKDPIELGPYDIGNFGPSNSTSSTVIITSVDSFYSTVLNITFLDPYPDGSANADLLVEIQSGALTDIKVSFWNYGMPYGQEHELAAPANLSSVLANGTGRYGIRATGEFWTIDWLGALS